MTIKDIVRSVRRLLYSCIHSSTPDNTRLKKYINYLNHLITCLSNKKNLDILSVGHNIANHQLFWYLKYVKSKQQKS